jgi:D-alanyl-D-alanine carboxypeptidase/D-alanyl-D-alanine-endopeptidase (penicillin-binding protein 4)
MAGGMPKSLQQFLSSPIVAPANVGIIIQEAKTGKTVMEYRSDKCLIPASNMKLITTATALEMLGKDFRFETPLEYDGTIDSKGTLNGNIYIVGTGDPTTGSSVFNDGQFIARWIEAVRKAGIKAIRGHIIADVSAFDKEVTPPDWTWQNMGNYFAAGDYGLSLFDNSYTLTFRTGKPGTRPEITGTYPPMYELTFINRMKAGPTGSDDDDGYLHGAPFSNERIITGTIPPNRESFSIKGDMPNPPLKLATYFTEQLNAAGINVSAKPLDEAPGQASRTRFYTHLSPALSEIITETNYQSNNLYAEHLFKRLALISHSVATRSDAIETVKSFWNGKGVGTTGIFIEDGCGLSPVDGISPAFFAGLLRYMYTYSENKDVFINSLPVAGVSGTLKSLLADTPLAGKVRAKSGSIRRVLCYSGYIQNGKKEYVFSIMINNFSGSYKDMRKTIEPLLLEFK